MRIPYKPSNRSMIPLTIVGGERSAGKSTLLAHVLISAGRRVAALVRDPDRKLLAEFGARELSAESAELASGALCCGFDGDFACALARLSNMTPPPAHVLIEAAEGTPGELRRACGYAYMPGYRPDGVVLVVNAETAARGSDALDALPQSLHEANIVLMNKADLLSDAQMVRARNWLRRFAGSARVVTTRNGCLTAPLLLGLDPRADVDDMPLVHAEWSSDLDLGRGARPSRKAVDLELGDKCRGWSVHGSEPLDSYTFRSWVEHLPRTVLRGRGIVWLTSEPHVRYRFELMGVRWRLDRDGMWGNEPPTTSLMFVGMQSQYTVLSSPTTGGESPRVTATMLASPA